MKILVIAPSSIPVPPVLYGGSERIIHNLCTSLYRENHKVNLLAAKKSNQYNGKTLNYVDYRFGTSYFGRLLSWAEFQFQCLRLAKDVDLIHTFVFWPERLFFLNKIRKPIINSLHHTAHKDDFQRIVRANPHDGFLQCISHNQKKKIEIEDKNKAFVTHNCVDTNFFKPVQKKREDFLLYLGRLNYEKGVDIAVRLAIDSGMKLKIAGPVKKDERFAQKLYLEKVKPFLNHNIEHVGEVDDFQKRSLLSGARALIVPNRWEEPFGLMNIEALACGTPIIATNKGSLKEIILENKTGFLCNDYKDLLDAIKNIDFLSNKICIDEACNRFSIQKYWQNTEKIYRTILNNY